MVRIEPDVRAACQDGIAEQPRIAAGIPQALRKATVYLSDDEIERLGQGSEPTGCPRSESIRESVRRDSEEAASSLSLVMPRAR